MLNLGMSLYAKQIVAKFLRFVILESPQGNVQSLPIGVGQELKKVKNTVAKVLCCFIKGGTETGWIRLFASGVERFLHLSSDEAEMSTVNIQLSQCLAAFFYVSPRGLVLRLLTTGHTQSATALGSGILFSYPEISTIAGVQGLIVYTLSSSLPLSVFGFLALIVRRKCPEGFVLTQKASS